MKWLPIAFVILALAGCADESAPETQTTDPEAEGFVAPTLDAPTWNIGDAWHYENNFGNDFWLVVTQDQGSNYVLDTDDVDLAFFHDQNDISYIGNIGKANLEGSQGSSAIKYFDFPLSHDKTWTTTWDGITFDMVAHEAGDERFHIQAMQNDVIINQYVYSNATKFFEYISFGDQNGTEVFRMDLKEHRTGWTGETIRVNAEIGKQFQTGQADINVGENYDVEDGDLYLAINYGCTQGAYVLAIGPVESIPSIATADANSDGYSDQGQCPVQSNFNGIIAQAPIEGTWGHVMQGLENVNGIVWERNYERITL